MKKRKVGDKVLFDFYDAVVTEVDAEGVLSVKYRNGAFACSGRWLTVEDDNKKNRKLCEVFIKLENDIRQAEGTLNINWPNIHYWMKAYWQEACENKTKAGREEAVQLGRKFTAEIVARLKEIRDIEIPVYENATISLFRQ